jgi:hypothetical protein
MTVECGWDWSAGMIIVTRLHVGMTLTGSDVLVMGFSNVTLTVMVHSCRNNNNNNNNKLFTGSCKLNDNKQTNEFLIFSVLHIIALHAYTDSEFA